MDDISRELNSLKSVFSSVLDRIDSLSLLIDANSASSDESSDSSEQIDDSKLIERAEKLLRWSRAKADALNLGTGLFSDPCWDMCLDIYICDLKGQEIAVSSVAHSSGIPMTTAMRYINVMEEEGQLRKQPNPSDSRMIFVSTSDDFKEKIANVLKNLPE